MKKLLILSVLSVFRIQATIALVQHAESSTTASSLAYSSSVTAGNLLVVGVQTNSSTTSVSLSGSRCTYTRKAGRVFQTAAQGSEIWSCIANSSGAETVTVSFSGGATSGSIYLREYRATGGWQSGTDGTATANGGSGSLSPVVTNTFSTTQKNDLIVCLGEVGASTVTVGTGFEKFSQPGGGVQQGIEDHLNAGPGVYTGQLQYTPLANAAYELCAVAFAENSSAGGGSYATIY